MNVTYEWFSKNKEPHSFKHKVLFKNKHLLIVKTKFNYGYRSIGVAFHKGLESKFYGGLNFITGQIFFSWR